jgi:hypothetical protein
MHANPADLLAVIRLIDRVGREIKARFLPFVMKCSDKDHSARRCRSVAQMRAGKRVVVMIG